MRERGFVQGDELDAFLAAGFTCATDPDYVKKVLLVRYKIRGMT